MSFDQLRYSFDNILRELDDICRSIDDLTDIDNIPLETNDKSAITNKHTEKNSISTKKYQNYHLNFDLNQLTNNKKLSTNNHDTNTSSENTSKAYELYRQSIHSQKNSSPISISNRFNSISNNQSTFPLNSASNSKADILIRPNLVETFNESLNFYKTNKDTQKSEQLEPNSKRNERYMEKSPSFQSFQSQNKPSRYYSYSPDGISQFTLSTDRKSVV